MIITLSIVAGGCFLIITCVYKLSTGSVSSFLRESTPSYVVPITVKDYNVIGRVSVGKPAEGGKPQVFDIDLNTLNSETWLISAALCEKRDCPKEPFHGFDGSKSGTYKRTSHIITPASSSTPKLTGPGAKDQFKFGTGKDAPVVSIEFLEVTDHPFQYQGFDGSLGLNLMEDDFFLNEAPVFAFYMQLKEAVFGFYIRKTPRPNDYGHFILGGRDADFMTGPINAHQVVGGEGGAKLQGWHIPIEKMVLIHRDGSREEEELSVDIAAPVPMFDDIFLPAVDGYLLVEKIFEKSNIQRHPDNRKAFSCKSNLKDLPDIGFVMGGKEYILKPEEYTRRTSSGKSCTVAVGEYADEVLLGRVFMNKFYTRFHVEKKEIQFALAKHKR